MRNAFADKVSELARQNEKVVLLSGDIGNKLFDEIKSFAPDRFINCGIAEQNMMGVAAGLGLSGYIPIVYSITPFVTTRCLEQIRVAVAYHNSPVIIVGTGSGLSYASLGSTHHSLEDFAIFRAIPNIQILAPWDGRSTKVVLSEAINANKPSYIRIGKKGEPDVPIQGEYPSIGDGVMIKEGDSVCILAVGSIVSEALSAANILSKKGIDVGIGLTYSVKPPPISFIQQIVKRYQLIITVEEHSHIGGFGEQVLSILPHGFTNAAIIGAKDKFASVIGSQQYLQKFFGVDAENIVKVVENSFFQNRTIL